MRHTGDTLSPSLPLQTTFMVAAGPLPDLPCLCFQPQTLQLDFLMKILPNYHHLKKTMKATSTPIKS